VPTRLAAVDIGSNTVHVLVADVDRPKQLTDVAHYVEMPELGARVDRDGRLSPEGCREAIEALTSVVARARRHGFEHLVAGATAAIRRAADGSRLLTEASAAIGIPVRLLSEQREAELTFLGAALRHAVPAIWLLADLGGGSTELVVGYGGDIFRWSSLPLGSGAMAARFLSDPPTSEEREALVRQARAILVDAPAGHPERLVATGGTASHLPLLVDAPDPSLTIDRPALEAARERLDAQPEAAVSEATGISEKRIRALRAGAEILLLLLDQYGLDALQVSHEGLRHGMILAYLRRGEDWWREESNASA
jgi:exopolyphosphatase / guanosine-5'-triphosphate,3'-diphosphate pyrophosphatase